MTEIAKIRVVGIVITLILGVLVFQVATHEPPPKRKHNTIEQRLKEIREGFYGCQ